MKSVLTIAILFSVCFMANGQTNDSIKRVIINGDTVDIITFDPVEISAGMDAEKILKYKKLKRNVRIVMPYAKLAAYKMRTMEDKLIQIKSKRERKKYIKECEKTMKELYMAQLKDLSIDQGIVLMKLIHRETGKTTWEIMKNYRGTPETIFWQAFGSIYGHDMKVEYDPVMDYEIENIIRVEKLE